MSGRRSTRKTPEGSSRPAPAGYSGTPLPRKLGILEGRSVLLRGAPEGFEATLGELPDGVSIRRSGRAAADITLWFARSAGEVRNGIAAMAPSAAGGGLWILWPKKASGVVTDLTESVVRETGLAAGLVDFKVAAIDATWSGLRFSISKGIPMTRKEPLVLLALTVLVLVISGIHPEDRLTWVLEILPVVIFAPILIYTARSFPLTSLCYRLIFIHAIILIVGGHYTYAKVPLGLWAQEAFNLARNHYDRLGHLAQGFIPAIIAREVLLRRTPLRPGGWLFYLVTSVCLAISAAFELVEWTAAVSFGQEADAYLATQGDVWDTQKDMLMALIGSMAAQLLLGRMQDTQLAAMKKTV